MRGGTSALPFSSSSAIASTASSCRYGMRRTVAASAGVSRSKEMAESESRSESRVCATHRSQARAEATAVASCARPTVVSNSARLTEKDSQPRTSIGTNPTTARTRKTRDRKGTAALGVGGNQLCHCKEERECAATERMSAQRALAARLNHFSLTFPCPVQGEARGDLYGLIDECQASGAA